MKKAQLNLFDEIIVDNFAGGGGAGSGKSMKADRTPDALRRAAALLEQYQALGTPDRLREIRRREIDLTVENFILRRRLEEQQEVINRLNRRLDAVQANARERKWNP